MLQAGIGHILCPGLQAAKKPLFDTNDRFDFSVFGVKFDVFLARSIWTHAPKSQIQIMLDGFIRNSSPDAFLLTSYYPASWFGRKNAIIKVRTGSGRAIFPRNPARFVTSAVGSKTDVVPEDCFVDILANLHLMGSTD
jgi:hypothetical protein